MMKLINSIMLLTVLTLSSCCPHKFIPCENPPPPPPFCVPERIRVALVLGSGGVRGTAHLGVLEELEAAGIPIDLIVGCSAGSIVGALYAERPCCAEIVDAVWGMRTNSMLDIDIWECRYGLSQGKSMHWVIDEYLDAETFEELQIPFVAVASDLHSGELVPMGSGDLVKAVQASCSIPFVFVPCEHMDRILVDGGCVNPVPAKVARDLGAEIIIAVDLCELLKKTFPTNLFGVMTRSAEIAFMWQNESCCREADVVIRPKTCGIGAFKDTMKWELYEAGKEAAREKMDEILELISSIPEESQRSCTKMRTVHLPCYTPDIYHNY